MPDDIYMDEAAQAFDFLDYDEGEAEKRLEDLNEGDEDSAAAYVDSKYEEAVQRRWHIVLDWVQNKQFVRGDQWPALIQHSEDQDAQAADVELAEWDVRVTVNAMFNVVRVLVAKLTSQDIIPGVIPVTSDEADRGKARACENLLKYFMRAEKFDREILDVATNMVETGTAWLRISWDSSKGEFIVNDEDIEEAEEMGATSKEMRQKTGGLHVRSWSPLKVGCDPGAMRFEDARWMYCEHDMHVHAIFENWGVNIPPDAETSKYHVGDENYGLSEEHENAEDMVQVIEFWEKPSPEHPLGRYVVTGGNKVLYKEEGLPGGKFPFVQFLFYPDPDSLYGITPASFARQLQKQINMNTSSMVMGREHSQFGKWLEPDGANMSTPTRAPGEVLTYDPSQGKPDFVQPTPFSPQVFGLDELFKNWFQYVFGANDATMGDTSGGASGRAIAFQAEEDSTKLGPTMRLLKESLRESFMKMLDTWREYAQGPIKYATFGANAVADMHELDREDIEWFDIEILLETALPQNKQARRELIIMLVQAGIITDPNEARRMMEFGDIEDAFGSRNVDRQRALRENQLLLEGPVNVRMWEDHVIHMEVLLQHMKGAEFYAYPPDVQQRFEMHLQNHMLALQGGLQPAQGGPASGGGSQPLPPQGEQASDVPTATGDMVSPQEQQAMQAIQGPGL